LRKKTIKDNETQSEFTKAEMGALQKELSELSNVPNQARSQLPGNHRGACAAKPSTTSLLIPFALTVLPAAPLSLLHSSLFAFVIDRIQEIVHDRKRRNCIQEMFTIENVEIALGLLRTCPSCSSPLLISSLLQAAESQSHEVLSPGTACEYLRRISDANLVQAESELNEVHADISLCKTQTQTQKLYYSLLLKSNRV
jgi:hypothetical protein